MEKIILIFLLLSSQSFAENSRSPAVLSQSCNINISTDIKVIVDGHTVVKERDVQEIQKEQCHEIKKCMNSASDEELEELKKLADVACNNTLIGINTKIPSAKIDKNYNGVRSEKILEDSDHITPVIKPTDSQGK